MSGAAKGPLAGVRVLEFAGIGPGPHGCMLLSDMGAEVVRINRAGASLDPVMDRGRRNLDLDLKNPDDLALCLAAIDAADVVVEGYRPGVMERLGLGPEPMLERNPRLIYARMTGWGQDGPLAQAAGHDINYIALTGALAAIGPKGQPSVPPLNLVGDFGGGSLYLAMGIAAALFEREKSGRGQVIDAAIVDGAASLLAIFASGRISLEKERSMLGGAAPYYRCYLCSDGREVAVGALEPKFYDELCQIVGVEVSPDRLKHATWAGSSEAFAAIFKTRTRDEWCDVLEGTDACFAPVMEMGEAPRHPHMAQRQTYQLRDGVTHPAPAPRFSRTPGAIQTSDAAGRAALAAWGVAMPKEEVR